MTNLCCSKPLNRNGELIESPQKKQTKASFTAFNCPFADQQLSASLTLRQLL